MGDEDLQQAKRNKVQKSTKPVKQDVAKAPEAPKGGPSKKGQKEDPKIQEENKEIEKAEAKITHADDKKTEKKVILEREYIVPLRKEFRKVPEYKRANKATKALKEFIAKHMKVYDRDLRKIKIDILLNNEIRFRGMRKPLAKIKVKALKNDDGTVNVKLVNIPKHIKFELAREAKKQVEKSKKEESKKLQQALAAAKAEKEAKKTEGEKKEDNKKDKDTKEKEIASKEATQAMEKSQAKAAKHTSTKKAPIVQRKALAK